jgi:hypothetical protein
MIYNFNDIDNKELYTKSRVAFITGQYPVFNDLVVDKFKDYNKSKVEVTDTSMLDEFGYDTSDIEQLNKIGYDEFFKVIDTRPLYGKWFCNVQYSELSKKQISLLEEYYKKPSDNGVLLVNCLEFKEYMKFTRDKRIKTSEHTSLIKLNFPDDDTLRSIIKQMLGDVGIEPKAISLFMIRLGKDYNNYSSLLGRFRIKYEGGCITYKDMLLELKDIENYTLDYFMIKLSQPLDIDKISKRKKIYSIQRALVNELGYTELLKKISYKVKDLIEMRILINTGQVPVGIKFNADKVKNKLPEKHPLKKLSNNGFRATAWMASRYCIRDLILIKDMISSLGNLYKANQFECAKVLNSIVNRTTFDKDRLLNDIKIQNQIEESLYVVNTATPKENQETPKEFNRIIVSDLYHLPIG